MPSITRYVNHSLDDAYTDSGSTINTSGFISAGNSGGVNRRAEIIFRNIPIRRGAVINSASIVFTSIANLSGTTCDTTLVGEASSSPAQFSTYADFVGRSETSASVAWNDLPAWVTDTEYTTVDIKTIVQEIVNRSDWNWGGSVGILWKNNSSSTNARRAAYGFEDDISKCARIVIDYTQERTVGIKIAYSGVNALTNTNPSNFSLYIDGTDDHILVKEFSRGTQSVNSGATSTTAHNLGYPPLFSSFVEILGGEYQWNYGYSPYSDYRVYVDTTNYYLVNGGGSSKTFSTFLFYDKVTNT